MLEIAVWVAVVEVLGLAALPLLRAAFGGRRDAALLSRPIGLAVAAWLAWVVSLAPGIPFSRRTLWIAVAVVAAASWAVHRRSVAAGRHGAAGPWWGADEKRAALLFWSAAAIFVFIRACLPDILGQEKFMDLAFFNSLIRHPDTPPLDPWLAGSTINYYYWGYLLAAALARLSGVASLTAYNLVIATFAAYSFVAAVCLGLRLTGRLRAGIWAGVAAIFAGNPAGAFDALRAPLGRGFDYWHASRVIQTGGAIDEFPFFTFFQADMHPHLLGFPFFLAAFAAGSRVLELRPPAAAESGGWKARIGAAWPALLLAFVAGTARAANNWTLPVLVILVVGVSVLRRSGVRVPSPGEAFRGAAWGAILSLLSLVLWWPYSRSYSLPSNGLAPVTLKSGVVEFLLFWGILFAVALVGLWPRESPPDEAGRRRRDLRAAVLAAVSIAAAFATRTPALLAVVPLLLLSGELTRAALKAPEPAPSRVATGLMLFLAMAIIGGCEFIYFRDSYGTDNQRMNTVFKFYNQAWPLLAIGAAALAEEAWRTARRASRSPVRWILAACAVLAMLYPFDAALSRWRIREGRFTLDATHALVRRSAADAAAIGWLEEHAGPHAVVVEASGDPYSEFARVSSHTGIPTVLGWANHEGLWRGHGSDQEISDRAALLGAFYSGNDERVATLFLQKYKVTHVVLGDLERRRYPGADRIASYLLLKSEFPGPTTVYSVRAPR
ncbi:MAG: DUF2298 domain-containing protein [Acidobacteriota bacterium]